MVGASREAVIDFEFLRGRQNETASETFRFKSAYKMTDHGSSQNGINSADGHIEYKELHTVINEAVSGFAHLYAYGVPNSRSTLSSRPVRSIT